MEINVSKQLRLGPLTGTVFCNVQHEHAYILSTSTILANQPNPEIKTKGKADGEQEKE